MKNQVLFGSFKCLTRRQTFYPRRFAQSYLFPLKKRKGILADEIMQRVMGKLQCGSIVLFHNADEHTPEALPAILDYLSKEGYRLVPISEIICKGDYTIDHTGRQYPCT